MDFSGHTRTRQRSSEGSMYHTETAYTFAKERQRQLEREALEGSPILSLLARLIRRP